MSEDTKRRVVYGVLDEDTHLALCALATDRGDRTMDLIEQSVVRFISEETRAMGDTAPIDLRIYLGLQSARKAERRRAQLTQIAWGHVQNPTEETADLLAELCESAGIAVEDIIEEVQGSPIVPVGEDNGTGKASCMRWLQRFLKPGRNYPATTVRVKARSAGFSEGVLKSAKAELGVRSRRLPRYWVWVLDPSEPVHVPASVPA